MTEGRIAKGVAVVVNVKTPFGLASRRPYPPTGGGLRLRDYTATGASAMTLIAARQNAGRSSGLREVTRLPSTTTSASSKRAPALTTSSLIAKKQVARRPFR